MFFYGHVKSNGTKNETVAHSRNWTVEKVAGRTGYYKITLDQHLHYAPLVVTTINQGTPAYNAPPRIVQAWHKSEGGKWAIYVKTSQQASESSETGPFNCSKNHTHSYFRSGFGATNLGFSFSVRCGMTRVFDVSTDDTVTLTPKVVLFNNKTILVLETDHVNLKIGDELYLDKGTVLIGVGETMKLELSPSVVGYTPPGGVERTWDLTGWTYGGGYGHQGKTWGAPDYPNHFSVDASNDGHGPATTLYTFAIKGVLQGDADEDNGITKHISSDPVVRLSSVPPGGLMLVADENIGA